MSLAQHDINDMSSSSSVLGLLATQNPQSTEDLPKADFHYLEKLLKAKCRISDFDMMRVEEPVSFFTAYTDGLKQFV